MIFHDSALAEMATVKPTTFGAFSRISGVGKMKLEKYGEVFVECILDYLAPK